MTSRELKFRQPIRDKDGKFVEWHYWGIIDGEWVPPQMKTVYYLDTITESQQYIGLKDKHGKEIYRKDVVSFNNCISVVEFFAGVYRIFSPNPMILGLDVNFNELEVIGNIYEHKNLLEEKQ
jgi:hypothetical protein